MRITFSRVNEFLDELREDRGQVEDGILRVTCIYREHKDIPVLHLTVYAGCVIRGKIVELRHYVGHTWQNPDPDDKVRPKAEEIKNRIILAATSELNLDVRAGMFQ